MDFHHALVLEDGEHGETRMDIDTGDAAHKRPVYL